MRVRQMLLAMAASLVMLTPPLLAQTRSDTSVALHDMQWGRTTYIQSEVLELLPSRADRPVVFDLLAWSGGATQRLWIKAEGEVATRGGGSTGQYQFLYGRLVSPFWDAQLGLRADVRNSGGRTNSRMGAVAGFQGLAPGRFEMEPSVFVSTAGDVALDLTASYDVYFTQRLVLQPRLEGSASLTDVPEFGVGAGLSHGSLALRARYEFRREIAPYVGIVWDRQFGATADFSRAAGNDSRHASLVVGLRLWH
ncbi:MAG: copper resistance protein B [Gemmatimonadota bacterium]